MSSLHPTRDPVPDHIWTLRKEFSQSSDVFITARAIAINSGLPGAIFRFASKKPGGIQSVFQDPYGWLNTTSKIYVSSSLIKSTPKIDSSWKKTQHLAVAAQAVYFGPRNEPIPAILTTNVQRLILATTSNSWRISSKV